MQAKNIGKTEFELYVNVYDIEKKHVHLKRIGLGIYHTGVIIYNKELAYGKHTSEG